MQPTFTVNIGFNISNPLREEIYKISQKIRDEYGSDWWVDDIRYHLHFPLFLMECPEQNRHKLIQVAKEFVKNLQPIEVKSNNIFASESGLIMISFAVSRQLLEFHERCLELFNPIREDFQREKYQDQVFLNSLPEVDRKNILKYGHIWVLEKYQPHITIARIKDKSLAQRVVSEYRNLFLDKSSELERFQIHEPIFGPNGKTILLVDEPLTS